MVENKFSPSTVTREDSELIDDKNVKPVRRLMTPLLSTRVPPVPHESERKEFLLLNTNIISRTFFTWLIPLFNKGYKRTLDFNDLWKLDQRLSINTTYPKFQHYLNRIIAENETKNGRTQGIPRFGIIKALFYTFMWDYLFSIAAATLFNGCQVVIPILLKHLIDTVQHKVLEPNASIKDGIGYAVGIVGLLALNALLFNHSLQHSKFVAAHARTILTKALLEKSFVASAETQHYFSNGKIFSLMSSDLSKIELGISFLPNALATPLPIMAAIAIIIVNLGPAGLSGIGVFLLTVIMFIIPGTLLVKYRQKSAKYTDKRVSLMREVLMAMKMIKLHSWEYAYQKKIFEERTKESNYIFKCEWLTNLMYGAVFNLASTSSMTAFLVSHATRSENNSPGSIFSSLALYNTLMIIIAECPMILGYCTSASVSFTRIHEFLNAAVEDVEHDKKWDDLEANVSIEVKEGAFEWETFEDNEKANNFNLYDINLNVHRGEFVIITGAIGSGKSTLLHAINGDIKKTAGEIKIQGSSVFYGNPWIQSATIRENIVFGSKFDPVYYYKTIKACALEPDIAFLPAGDMTEVGERGVTLSGGQKARISLARAVYARKDIYLLDDVLSAVDAKVAKHIVEKCFFGLIADKTKLLATHQLSLVYSADRVVFMNDGNGMIDVGKPSELYQRNPTFGALMDHITKETTQESAEAKPERDLEGDVEMDQEMDQDLGNFDPKEGGLYNAEEKAVDAIPLSIYKQYLNAGSGVFSVYALPLLIGITILTVFVTMFANVWLSFWVDEKFSGKSSGFYIGIYITFVFLGLLFLFLELSTLGYLTINASKTLNLNAVARLLRTTMKFIDGTPSGRILNRFTKDTNSLDNEIGNQLKMLIHMVASVIGILILCVIYLPWFAIAIPLLFIIFFMITNYYQASSREIKRLEALSRSHVYDNFNEVLNGMSTIKSFGSQERFMNKNDKCVDKLNEAYFVTVANQRWIGITLDLTGCGITFHVTMLALTRQFNLTAASTGLITSYVLDLAGSLSPTLVAYSEVENEMNSVERLCHYANSLDQEGAFEVPGETLPPDWPQKGHIEFINVSLRFREGVPPAVRNLNINIRPSEKVGVCGRTGAGKSTLITALYRIVELCEGKIKIDGIDVRKIGLHTLRSRVSIIPQDPVLFRGTIRKNLDPFDQRTDMELWDALRRSSLFSSEEIKAIKEGKDGENSKFHLHSVVEEEGSNFSLGERQLLALARSLVLRSRILIMDEATSNVDYETDCLVQKTVAREFKDCTVISIAHRLKTILSYDKIIVLDNGELVEFDEPFELYNKGGLFRSMCENSCINTEDFRSFI